MNGRRLVSAVEDNSSVIVGDALASAIVESIEKLDLEISDALDIADLQNEASIKNQVNAQLSGISTSAPKSASISQDDSTELEA